MTHSWFCVDDEWHYGWLCMLVLPSDTLYCQETSYGCACTSREPVGNFHSFCDSSRSSDATWLELVCEWINVNQGADDISSRWTEFRETGTKLAKILLVLYLHQVDRLVKQKRHWWNVVCSSGSVTEFVTQRIRLYVEAVDTFETSDMKFIYKKLRYNIRAIYMALINLMLQNHLR